MQTFRPCAGKNVCTENATHCLACGRKLEIVARTRSLIDDLTSLILDEEYSNIEAFMEYVGTKTIKKVKHQRGQGDQAGHGRHEGSFG